jgi:guanylate kinase
MKGPLIILSGPSGAGKTTVAERLRAEGGLPLWVSVSATTRPPRAGERDGVHYHFWTRERFEEGIRAGAFLEWAEVHGHYYGTPRAEVERRRQEGLAVLLVIDVAGAAQVRRLVPDSVSVFLRTTSWDEYEKRLRRRGTEDEAAIQRRLANARRELGQAGGYAYQVLNDDLGTAVARLREIVLESLERGSACSTS